MADFGRRTGLGMTLRGRAEDVEKYRRPGEYASRQAIKERLASELKHYGTFIGDNTKSLRYDLAARIVDLPQLAHMNMTVTAAALYIENKTPPGSEIPSITEDDLVRLESRFFNITDRPDPRVARLGLKADLIRYFGLIRNHVASQYINLEGDYVVEEEE